MPGMVQKISRHKVNPAMPKLNPFSPTYGLDLLQYLNLMSPPQSAFEPNASGFETPPPKQPVSPPIWTEDFMDPAKLPTARPPSPIRALSITTPEIAKFVDNVYNIHHAAHERAKLLNPKEPSPQPQSSPRKLSWESQSYEPPFLVDPMLLPPTGAPHPIREHSITTPEISRFVETVYEAHRAHHSQQQKTVTPPPPPNPSRLLDYDDTKTYFVNYARIDPRDVEPPLGADTLGNDRLCFHGVNVICPVSRLEAKVIAQLDDGAVPSIISTQLATQLNANLQPRTPIRVEGIGGTVTLTHECILSMEYSVSYMPIA